jgi:hypothetical protein
MKKSSFIDDFANWLSINGDRLPATLVASVDRKGRKREYRIQGVPSLRVWVGDGSLEVAVIFRRQFVDLLRDFDVALRQTARGKYYCAFRTHPKYMKDRLSLLRSHSFKPFLTWCRENIRADRLLVIEMEPGSWSAAHILTRQELKIRWARLGPGFIIKPVIEVQARPVGGRPAPSRQREL